jgi:type IV pilus assembly protein PilN
MIKINLLPVRAAKKREFGRQQIILFALVLVLAAIGNFYWWQTTEKRLTDIRAQIERTKAEIARLEKTIGEVKTIDREKKALEDKLKILDTLKKGRTGPVKVLDELATIIPPKVWIADYIEAAQAVQLRGSAASYEDFSAFIKKLKGSRHFRDVVIRRAQQGNGGIVTWEITCVADYSAA